MKVLTSRGMRALDRRAIDEIGIPGPVLMENAAIGVVDALLEHFPDAQSVAIFCGPGNNGGDGLAVARHLLVRGCQPSAWLVTGGKTLSSDAELQLRVCRALGMEVGEIADES